MLKSYRGIRTDKIKLINTWTRLFNRFNFTSIHLLWSLVIIDKSQWSELNEKRYYSLCKNKSPLNHNRRVKKLLARMFGSFRVNARALLALSICSQYPGLKKEDEKGKRVEGGEGRKGRRRWRGKGSELLRRPEADGGQAIAAGCSSSFFDLGLAY